MPGERESIKERLESSDQYPNKKLGIFLITKKPSKTQNDIRYSKKKKEEVNTMQSFGIILAATVLKEIMFSK